MRLRSGFWSDALRLPELFWAPLHKIGLWILQRALLSGDLTIISPDGSTTPLGNQKGYSATVRFNTYSSLPRMMANPWYAIGAHYVNGLWDLEEGRLADVLALLARHGNQAEQKSFLGKVAFRLRRALFVYRQRYGIARSVRNVQKHYDFGDDLFAAFLDSKLNYTCADFECGAADIDEAQETKLRNALKRLSLRPGHRLLEIGCGWGALSCLAASEYGADVTALTLSENQLRYSERAGDEACGGRKPKYLLEDYRQHERGKSGLYDRVVSVGMLEHVGLGQLEVYFSELNRLLKEDGVALVHTIARYRAGVTNPWIERHIFPGGYIAQEAEILNAATKNGFTICDETYHYRAANYIETLRRWADRFHHSWPVLLKHKYPERLRRTYDFYFAASEAAFRELDMQAAQFVFRKRRVKRTPLS